MQTPTITDTRHVVFAVDSWWLIGGIALAALAVTLYLLRRRGKPE